MRDSFTFFRSFYEAIEHLNVNEKLEVLEAIIRYALFDEEKDNQNPIARAVLTMAKPNIDASNKKRDIGKTGGSRTKSAYKQNEKCFKAESEVLLSNKERDKDKEMDKEVEMEVDKDRDIDKDIYNVGHSADDSYLHKDLDAANPPYKEIVDYLNQAAGTAFKSTSRDTQKHIKARLAEGYTVDDFETVIDKKVAEWGPDPEWCKYIRPSTLFGTKFEAYLNQAVKRHKSVVEEVNEWHI